MSSPLTLVKSLSDAIDLIQQNPCPHVPNPHDFQKRASAALVLRIRPNHADGTALMSGQSDSGLNAEPPKTLPDFFARSWVQNGDPELLFIKRATRRGDRWSGHIALPGGVRDPSDVDDRAVAIRETMEEVGLDLTRRDCLFVGNLPDRVVTTTWGKKGLLILCPFVFVITSAVYPSLLLQPAEVAATHWVPLRGLLSPSLRTRQLVDVSSRIGKQEVPLLRPMLRFMLGKMAFSAIRLIPSESLFASPIPGFIPQQSENATGPSKLANGSFGLPSSTDHGEALMLWGLTLGIVADLLQMLPPHNAVKLWHYPTFTTPDLRVLIYLITYKLRKDNARHLSDGTWPTQTAVDASTTGVAISGVELRRENPNDVGPVTPGIGERPSRVLGLMLSAYYERINIAIAVCLVTRVAAAGALGYGTLRALKSWRP